MPLALAPQGRPLPFCVAFNLPPSQDYSHNHQNIYKAAKRNRSINISVNVFDVKRKPVPDQRKGCALVLDIISRAFTWTIWWDIENVAIPTNVNGAQAVKALVNSVRSLRSTKMHDSVRKITAYMNVNRLSKPLRNELQTNGVDLNHVETKNRKDASDKALMTDMMLRVKEHHPSNSGIVLISGDQDFSCPLASLRSYGYATAVIAPTSRACSPLLMNIPNYVLSWRNDVLKEFDLPSHTAPRKAPRKLDNRNAAAQNTSNRNSKNVAAFNTARLTSAVMFTGACSFGLAAAIFMARSIIAGSRVSYSNSDVVSVVGVLVLALQCTLTWYFIQGGKKQSQRKYKNAKKKGKGRRNNTMKKSSNGSGSGKRYSNNRYTPRRRLALCCNLKNPADL